MPIQHVRLYVGREPMTLEMSNKDFAAAACTVIYISSAVNPVMFIIRTARFCDVTASYSKRVQFIYIQFEIQYVILFALLIAHSRITSNSLTSFWLSFNRPITLLTNPPYLWINFPKTENPNAPIGNLS